MTVDELKKRLSLPVIGAPMFLASGVDLVVAQCCAGIVGAFPALNARPATELDNWLTEIETRLDAFEKETGTKPAPHAVNLIVHKSNPRVDEDLATLVRHRVPLVITSLSAPDKVVEAVHGYGGLVFHDITTRRHAEKAAGVGVDGLILACGHSGHGIQQAIATGRAVSELVLGGGYATLDLAPFGYGRYARGERMLERNIV